MKFKFIIVYIFIVGTFLFSCEDYLDVPRETTEILHEDIFTSYLETKNYLNQVYANIHIFAHSPDQNYAHVGWWSMYPMAACDEYIHPGSRDGAPRMGEEWWFDVDQFNERFCEPDRLDHNRWPFWVSTWQAIRAASVVISNASLITDATDKQINEIIGQAYYGRAFTYWYLLAIHGGMPYFKEPIDANDNPDYTRLSYHETVNNIISDLDSAAKYLPSSWEIPGSDPFATEDYGRYTSAAAKGLKGRALLFDASPLSYHSDEIMGYPTINNEQERWEKAAEACWEAIEFAEAKGYELLPGDSLNYKKIFRGEWATREYLHTITNINRSSGYNINHRELTSMFFPGILVGPIYDKNRGVDVSQDMVDKFEAVETDGSGNIIRALPIEDARSEGFYNDQNPYINRDPRFRYDIIYHGSLKPGYGTGRTDTTWNFSRESIKPGFFNDDFDKNSPFQNNKSGYYTRKYWQGESEVLYNINGPWTWIIMRMAELYLNYAEAANQAYGPQGRAPGANMTALEALNAIRNRVGMPDVDTRYTGSKESLHERILNERAVELCFEFINRYTDVRRWRIIETEEYQNTPNIIYITSTSDLINYPTGYVYEKRPYMVNNVLYRRTFQLKHYFLPLSKADIQKVPEFRQNPGY
ncbi:MAG: RagB/SusD family nutrient uptake outer membrane protein [Bacteroidales bacterium]|nr:RagB/SusD family nutrient uptake outer membrane protein [Bacteroidales bacterium]MCF8389564.1 RagB/SusD family nutrient uptake outer membrane protein [Bacteroidales bacterium]